jgi:hypothetical protein
MAPPDLMQPPPPFSVDQFARGTGADGPLELTGMDRIRTEDGRVKENIIRYDTAALEAAVG